MHRVSPAAPAAPGARSPPRIAPDRAHISFPHRPEDVLKAPRLKSRLPGERAASWVDRDQEVISTSYTRSYPLVVERGKGLWLTDVDGNEFLDMNAGIAVGATGHSHPKVVRAIQEQADKFLHMSGTDFYYPQEVQLAERLA